MKKSLVNYLNGDRDIFVSFAGGDSWIMTEFFMIKVFSEDLFEVKRIAKLMSEDFNKFAKHTWKIDSSGKAEPVSWGPVDMIQDFERRLEPTGFIIVQENNPDVSVLMDAESGDNVLVDTRFFDWVTDAVEYEMLAHHKLFSPVVFLNKDVEPVAGSCPVRRNMDYKVVSTE